MTRATGALALALLMLATGCVSSPAPAPSVAPGEVELDVTVLPWADHLSFRTATYNGALVNLTPSTLAVVVHKRDILVGTNSTTLELGARHIAHADLDTPFLGIGDYYWNVTVTSPSGQVVANKSGLYETCFC